MKFKLSNNCLTLRKSHKTTKKEYILLTIEVNCCPKIHMSHTVALGDMFLCYHESTNCSSFWMHPSYPITVLIYFFVVFFGKFYLLRSATDGLGKSKLLKGLPIIGFGLTCHLKNRKRPTLSQICFVEKWIFWLFLCASVWVYYLPVWCDLHWWSPQPLGSAPKQWRQNYKLCGWIKLVSIFDLI